MQFAASRDVAPTLRATATTPSNRSANPKQAAASTAATYVNTSRRLAFPVLDGEVTRGVAQRASHHGDILIIIADDVFPHDVAFRCHLDNASRLAIGDEHIAIGEVLMLAAPEAEPFLFGRSTIADRRFAGSRVHFHDL